MCVRLFLPRASLPPARRARRGVASAARSLAHLLSPSLSLSLSLSLAPPRREPQVDALEGTVELAAKRTALIEDRSSEMEARLVSATAARQDATLPNVRAPKAAIRQMVAQPRT